MAKAPAKTATKSAPTKATEAKKAAAAAQFAEADAKADPTQHEIDVGRAVRGY